MVYCLRIQCLNHSSTYPFYPRRHCQYSLTLQVFESCSTFIYFVFVLSNSLSWKYWCETVCFLANNGFCKHVANSISKHYVKVPHWLFDMIIWIIHYWAYLGWYVELFFMGVTYYENLLHKVHLSARILKTHKK